MVFARVIICFASLLLNVLDLKYNLAGLLFCILALKDGLWREFFVLASLLLCILGLTIVCGRVILCFGHLTFVYASFER